MIYDYNMIYYMTLMNDEINDVHEWHNMTNDMLVFIITSKWQNSMM